MKKIQPIKITGRYNPRDDWERVNPLQQKLFLLVEQQAAQELSAVYLL